MKFILYFCIFFISPLYAFAKNEHFVESSFGFDAIELSKQDQIVAENLINIIKLELVE
jgi:hypothetical protein